MSSAASAKDSPKISVIIPLYNHEQYIAEAVHSVLIQTFGDIELIIINDGSTDGSESVVKGIQDPRIRYFSQGNQGAPRSINRGIGLARGEYIGILNSDDAYYPERLSECLSVLEANPSLAATFSQVECVDSGGGHLRNVGRDDYCWKDRDPGTSFQGEKNIVFDLLAGNFLLTTSNLFCRKTVFAESGYFRNLRYTHDYEFFLRLCQGYGTTVIEKPLVRYRIHGLNTVSEDEAGVSFEVGLVLADFLIRHAHGELFGGDSGGYATMAKFLNSINTYRADRVMTTLLYFASCNGSVGRDFLDALADDPRNPFRAACIAHMKSTLESWSATDTLRAELVAMQKKWEKTDGLLQEKAGHLEAVLMSGSFRLGRALTWPARKILGKA